MLVTPGCQGGCEKQWWWQLSSYDWIALKNSLVFCPLSWGSGCFDMGLRFGVCNFLYPGSKSEASWHMARKPKGSFDKIRRSKPPAPRLLTFHRALHFPGNSAIIILPYTLEGCLAHFIIALSTAAHSQPSFRWQTNNWPLKIHSGMKPGIHRLSMKTIYFTFFLKKYFV